MHKDCLQGEPGAPGKVCAISSAQPWPTLRHWDGLEGEDARRWVAWKMLPLQSHPIRAECLVPVSVPSLNGQQGMTTDLSGMRDLTYAELEQDRAWE